MAKEYTSYCRSTNVSILNILKELRLLLLELLTLFRRADIVISREDVFIMVIDSLLKKRGMTKYRLAKESGIPNTTLNDIFSGKTKLEKCSAETVYKLAKALDVSMEFLTSEGIHQTERERSYEYGLPSYLQHDLDAYKEGLKNKSSLLDCLWGELYGSINIAEINDGTITKEHADYLRKNSFSKVNGEFASQ